MKHASQFRLVYGFRRRVRVVEDGELGRDAYLGYQGQKRKPFSGTDGSVLSHSGKFDLTIQFPEENINGVVLNSCRCTRNVGWFDRSNAAVGCYSQNIVDLVESSRTAF